MQIAGLNQKLLKKFSLNRENIITKVKNTGLYMLVPIVSFTVSFFTSPLFAKYLTPEEFGYFGYYTSISAFLTCFFTLQFPTYHMSVFYRYDEPGRRSMLSTLVLFNLLWNIVFFPLACFGVFMYMKYSHSNVPFFPLALVAFGTAMIANYKIYVQVNYRLGQRAFMYFIFVTGYRVLPTVVSLYFVMNERMGLLGRLVGIMIVEVFFFVISLFHIFKGQKLIIRKDIIKHAFKVIYPLLPATLLYLPLLSYDNIVLERLHQPAEMGFYNIGKGIGSYMYTALFPFYQVFEPDIYKNAVLKNTKALKKTSLILISIVVISLVGFWIFSPILINYLTAGKYIAALKYSNVLSVTSCLVIVYSILDAIINALHETKKSLLVMAISACLSIGFCTLAAKYFAQIGVAYATAIVYFCMICMQAFFVIRKFKKDPYPENVLHE